jgi:protein tyrosine/serine phosphatase
LLSGLKTCVGRRGWLAIAAAAALTGCGVGAYDDYAPLTVFDNFRTVEEGRAYRSAQLDGQTLKLVLDTYGIRTVVNLRGENADQPWYQHEQAATAAAGVTLVDIGMSANHFPSRATLLKLYDTFQTADYPILIHCNGGADRSGAAAAIWRMEVSGDSRQAAQTELSPLFGHFAAAYPAMDELVQLFEPDRAWILNEYVAPASVAPASCR